MLEEPALQELCSGLVSSAYVSQGAQELAIHSRLVKALLSSRAMPETGWSETAIERLLSDLALMDSNNFSGNAGVGEREGRVACPLVRRRNFGLAHGIGRSGDIAAEQPKTRVQAAGSSLLARVTHFLVLDALRLAGLAEAAAVQVFPLATGMAMTSAFLACAALRPDPAAARYVIWSRVDQKTCLKAIVAANLTPVVIELARGGDELGTDVDGVALAIARVTPQAVACVVTTTSCFAPRGCDDVKAVAKVCAAHDVPHVINNAYGVQSRWLCGQVSAACRAGRVDAIVQSTDKNFMVPVGGTVVAAPREWPEVLRRMASVYPGRASLAAHLDLGMTLLHLGRAGWREALAEREALYDALKERMQGVACCVGERVLESPRNPISIAMTVDTLSTAPAATGRTDGDSCGSGGEPARSRPSHAAATADAAERRDVTRLGAMLWHRRVSGARVIARGTAQKVAGIEFSGYGSSCDAYGSHYVTAAAAIGGSVAEVDAFCAKLQRCMAQCASCS